MLPRVVQDFITTQRQRLKLLKSLTLMKTDFCLSVFWSILFLIVLEKNNTKFLLWEIRNKPNRFMYLMCLPFFLLWCHQKCPTAMLTISELFSMLSFRNVAEKERHPTLCLVRMVRRSSLTRHHILVFYLRCSLEFVHYTPNHKV